MSMRMCARACVRLACVNVSTSISDIFLFFKCMFLHIIFTYIHTYIRIGITYTKMIYHYCILLSHVFMYIFAYSVSGSQDCLLLSQNSFAFVWHVSVMREWIM